MPDLNPPATIPPRAPGPLNSPSRSMDPGFRRLKFAFRGPSPNDSDKQNHPHYRSNPRGEAQPDLTSDHRRPRRPVGRARIAPAVDPDSKDRLSGDQADPVHLRFPGAE